MIPPKGSLGLSQNPFRKGEYHSVSFYPYTIYYYPPYFLTAEPVQFKAAIPPKANKLIDVFMHCDKNNPLWYVLEFKAWIPLRYKPFRRHTLISNSYGSVVLQRHPDWFYIGTIKVLFDDGICGWTNSRYIYDYVNSKTKEYDIEFIKNYLKDDY